MSTLSKSTANELKGIAIFMIVFHNFFHHLFRKTKENEIDFNPDRFEYFLTDFIYNPNEWVQASFTFFGHFGVQIFIFLSAYALVISYPDGGKAFFWSRIKKLYPTFISAILLWAIYWTATHTGSIGGFVDLLKNKGLHLLSVLFGLYPFYPGHRFPVVGPWWFIPFILQFYLFWAIFSPRLCNLSKKKVMGLIGAGLLVNYLLFPLVFITTKINLYLTVFGHLPEIAAAIYAARFGFPKLSHLAAIGIPALLLSSYTFWFYPLHHLSALFVFLPAALYICSKAKGITKTVINWLGTYSLTLFLVNGFLRTPFLEMAKNAGIWWMDMFSAIAFFCVACLVAYLLSHAITLVERSIAKIR